MNGSGTDEEDKEESDSDNGNLVCGETRYSTKPKTSQNINETDTNKEDGEKSGSDTGDLVSGETYPRYRPKPTKTQREHLQPAFLKKNPYHKAPVIDDDGFVLSESIAIMHYIAEKYNVADHWYPREDVKKQARVEEFLHWQHGCIRKHASTVVISIARSRLDLGPHLPKQQMDEELVNRSKEEVRRAVNHIAEYFLQGKPFIAGDEISVADIVGVSELKALDGVIEEGIYNSNEKVRDWVQRVRDKLQPHFDQAYEKMITFRDRFEAAK